MTFPRCETCRHWKPSQYDELGQCLASENSPLFTTGDGTYVLTRADFGCVLHEGKESFTLDHERIDDIH